MLKHKPYGSLIHCIWSCLISSNLRARQVKLVAPSAHQKTAEMQKKSNGRVVKKNDSNYSRMCNGNLKRNCPLLKENLRRRKCLGLTVYFVIKH